MGIVKAGRVLVKNGLNRGFVRSIAHAARQWDWAEDPCRLKRVSRQELLGPDVEVALSVTPGVFGETPVEDLMVVCALARVKAPRRLFEFGTFTGNTTLNLAMNTPQEGEIFTLDLSPEERAAMDGGRWEKTFGADAVGRRFRNTSHAARIAQILIDSTRFDAERFAESMDFIFVDACHDYELVKNDSEKAFRMLAPGGVVAWHDYTPGFPGVCRYLEEVASEREIRWVGGTSVAIYKGVDRKAMSPSA